MGNTASELLRLKTWTPASNVKEAQPNLQTNPGSGVPLRKSLTYPFSHVMDGKKRLEMVQWLGVTSLFLQKT